MRRRKLFGQHPAAPGWAGRRVLQVAHRLNEECIAALANAAAAEHRAADFNLIVELSELWMALDQAAIARAARCPVLLLDLNFARADWWHGAARGAAHPASRVLNGGVFPIEIPRDVLREVLTETWSAHRSMPRAVNLIFGMRPAVGEAIASLRVSAIERIVLEHASELRPRFGETLDFWRKLLQVSLDADAEGLADLHLYALQLLGRNLDLHADSSSPNERTGSP